MSVSINDDVTDARSPFKLVFSGKCRICVHRVLCCVLLCRCSRMLRSSCRPIRSILRSRLRCLLICFSSPTCPFLTSSWTKVGPENHAHLLTPSPPLELPQDMCRCVCVYPCVLVSILTMTNPDLSWVSLSCLIRFPSVLLRLFLFLLLAFFPSGHWG